MNIIEIDGVTGAEENQSEYTVSTSEPTSGDGNDGDFWYVYTA